MDEKGEVESEGITSREGLDVNNDNLDFTNELRYEEGGGSKGRESGDPYRANPRGEAIRPEWTPGRTLLYPGGNPKPKLLLNAASLDLDAEVFLLLSFPVVPPIKTSSLLGSSIQ